MINGCTVKIRHVSLGISTMSYNSDGNNYIPTFSTIVQKVSVHCIVVSGKSAS
jgi:hypothetical protein